MCRRVVGYYCSWAKYRGNFNISNINAASYTHLIFAFAGLGSELNSCGYSADIKQLVQLRERYPSLKVMVSVGGWNEGSSQFSDIASSKSSRRQFAINALKFLREYNLDGLDIDWEYPTQNGGCSSDKENFVALLSELSGRFREKKLLTVAVGASTSYIGTAYDVQGISRYVDFINLMTYDYSVGCSVTTHDSPLSLVKETVEKWLSAGAPNYKLIVGISFYPRTFTLQFRGPPTTGMPIKCPGKPGFLTKKSGHLTYYELCHGPWDLVKSEPMDFSVYDDQWATHETPRTVKRKVLYIQDRGLAGAMVWSVDADYDNKLLHAIVSVFG